MKGLLPNLQEGIVMPTDAYERTRNDIIWLGKGIGQEACHVAFHTNETVNFEPPDRPDLSEVLKGWFKYVPLFLVSATAG